MAQSKDAWGWASAWEGFLLVTSSCLFQAHPHPRPSSFHNNDDGISLSVTIIFISQWRSQNHLAKRITVLGHTARCLSPKSIPFLCPLCPAVPTAPTHTGIYQQSVVHFLFGETRYPHGVTDAAWTGRICLMCVTSKRSRPQWEEQLWVDLHSLTGSDTKAHCPPHSLHCMVHLFPSISPNWQGD